MARIFISHSSRDNDVAAELKTWLAAHGFDGIFLDIDKHAGIPPGANWERELYRKIDSVQAVILVVTPNWHDSKWCFVEFAQARALGKAIFPVIVAPGGDRFIAPDIQQLDLQLDREGGLERLARELTRLALDAQGGFVWNADRPPYPGLLAFEKEDAAVFFGRDDDIRSLIERLNARRVRGDIKFVALLGSSGSGKSSLVRAGVLPRIERDRNNWIVLPPFRPRREPVLEFARALCEALGTPEDWRKHMDGLTSAEAERKLEDLIEAARQRAGAREGYLLVTIDQGEELFSVAAAEQVSQLLELFARATAHDAPIVVLMALRSDYLGKLQEAAGALRFNEFSLGPFPLARVRQVIEGPARVAGIGVEEELIATAITDMKTDDALPLLAFMLRELHDRFGGHTQVAGEAELSLAHYRMLGDVKSDLNPLEYAVQRRAEEVVDGLGLSADSLAALREAFVGAMVRIGDDGQYVRRPALWDDIPKAAQSVLEKLAEARLVVIRSSSNATMVEVAHEALLRKWPRLRTWLDAEREFLVGKAQLRFALEDWVKQDAPDRDNALLRGLPLIRARQWLSDHARALTEDERRFVEASAARADAEDARAARRRRLAWAGVGTLIVLAAGTLLLAREQRAASTRAEAASLAVQARAALLADPLRAAAWAVQAVEKQSSADTLSILLESDLALSPHLSGVQRVAELLPTSLAWSPDSATVAVGGEGARLIQWRPLASNAADAVAEAKLSTGSAAVAKPPAVLTLTWDGASVTTVMDDGRIITSATTTGQQIVTQLPGIRKIALVAIGSSGRLLVSDFDDDDIRVFQCGAMPNSGAVSCTADSIASGRASALAFDDERSAAAIGFENGSLRIIGFGDDKFDVSPALGDLKKVVSLAFSNDGTHLGIGTLGGRTIVTDSRGGTPAEARPGSASVNAIAWDPGTRQLAATCDALAICIWRQPDSKGASSILQLVARLTGHLDIVRSLGFALGGSKLASASNDGTIRLWTIDETDRSYFSLDSGTDTALTDLDVSKDQRWLAAGDDKGSLYVWSLVTSALETAASGSDTEIEAIGWSPRGSILAAGNSEGHATVHSFPLNGKSQGFDVEDEVYALRWLADGTAILTSGSVNGAIDAHSAQGGQLPKFSNGHADRVLGLAVSADGKTLVSADALGKIRRWDIASRKLFGVPLDAYVSRDTIHFSRDGNRFLVAGNDGDVLVFRLEGDGKPIVCHSGSQQLDSAAFSPDDTVVAAISKDAVLYFWSLTAGCDLLASAPPPMLDADSTRAASLTAHRRHLVFVPDLKAIAMTTSTRRVLLISFDPQAWLERVRKLATPGASQ
jgi:WD40 repeat protein